MKKYRIVTDNYLGFEVQESLWFFWWKPSEGDSSVTNSYYTIERAKEHIEWLKRKPSKQKIVYTEQ